MRFWASKIDKSWREGRAHLHAARRWLRVEWNLWSRFCGVEIDRRDMEGAWTVMLAFPPIAVWISFGGSFRGGAEARELSLRIHDGAIWWRLWCDPNGWDSGRPRWRDGAWHPIDSLLGRAKYTSVNLATHAVVIPMPEGVYPATATFERCTWKRPRWFARVRDFTKIDIDREGGIPHEGKGENSWDCGTDGLCGYSTEGHNLARAVADGVERMLRYRRKYDGTMFPTYPSPSAPGRAVSSGGEGTTP
jgi:hypothetical protein